MSVRSARLIVAWSLSILLVGVVAAETRTWTDSTGKFKIEANFIEIVEGQVKLEKPDGKKVSLPLGKLSKEDQTYLRDLMKQRRNGQSEAANPFANEEDAAGDGDASASRPNFGPSSLRDRMARGRARLPRFDEEPKYNIGDEVEVKEFGEWQRGEIVGFDEAGHKTYVKLKNGAMVDAHGSFSIRPYDATLGPLAGVAETELARVDVTRIRRIVPLGGSSGDFQPDPAPSVGADWKPKPLGLNPQDNFFSHVVDVSFTNSGATAAVGHADRRGSHEGSLSQIEICDLKTGRVAAMVRGPRNLERLAASPDGKRLVTIGEQETFVSGPLQLWELGGKELKHLRSWHVNDGATGKKVEWIGWTDDKHVMTVDRSGLTLWAVDGPQGVYHIAGDGMQAPAFSPGGKQFAVGANEGVSIHDVASGELLARIALDHDFGRKTAFSPSGKLLAVTGSSVIEVYDIASGEKVTEAYCGSAFFDRGLCWLGDEHVLVGGTDLVHIPSQMTVWKYDHQAEQVRLLAGRVWYVFSGHGNETIAMLPFQLPHPAVKPVSESELALKPGDEVSMELELSIDLGQNAKGEAVSAQDELTKSLTAAGFLIVDDAPKRLIGRSMPGETKEIEYRMFGAPFGQTQKTSYTQRVFELELIADGQSVWKRRRVIEAPHHLRLQENESVDQAINRAMLADVGFFRSTIPSRVLPTAAEEKRTSKLSINGIQ